MNHQAQLIYEFYGFQLDVAQRVLTRNGEAVDLTPKAFDVLLFLVENRGRILEKDELMKALWPESFVEEGNLSHNIFVLRKTLGDDQNGNCLIQTIPRRGYKFVAPVSQVDYSKPLNGSAQGNGAAHHPVSPDYWSRHSPFRSLQIFEPEDSWLFFGRDSDTDELLARLGRSPILVVTGNSGSGKSSLLRAGLIPALQQGRFRWEGKSIDYWRIAILRPAAAPFDHLAENLPGSLASELSPAEQAAFIADCRKKLPASEDALRNAICALQSRILKDAPQARVLLVIDQFEEIFTLIGNETREKYIASLLAASSFDAPVSVHLVIVLRADFYPNCLEHAKLIGCLEKNLYNVPRMSPEQLRKSVEKRLALAGAKAEPGLLDSLLTDVGSEPGNLALLEHALGHLWEKCGAPSHILTNEGYAEIGRLRGALGKHADETYGCTDDKQGLVPRIFLELVQLGEGGQDTRRRVRKSELLALGAPVEIERLLAHLVSSRLITTSGEGAQIFIEISHEALIREWPMLREWIAQNREDIRLERRLIQSAEEWQALAREPGALLQGSRLTQAEAWLLDHPDVSSLLREFLQMSIIARADMVRRERITQMGERAQQEALSARLGLVLGALSLPMAIVVFLLGTTYKRVWFSGEQHFGSGYLTNPFEGQFWLSIAWPLSTFVLCVACWAAVKTQFSKYWKALTWYLFFEAIESIVLLSVFLLFPNGPEYYGLYHIFGLVEVGFKCLVVLEILIKILAPFEALSGRKIAWFCFWAVPSFSIAIALSPIQPVNHSWVALFPVVETTIYLANSVLLLVVLLQARTLGTSWRSPVTQIAVSFVFYNIIEAANRFAFYGLHKRIFELIDNISYLAMLAGWIWIMFHREPLSYSESKIEPE